MANVEIICPYCKASIRPEDCHVQEHDHNKELLVFCLMCWRCSWRGSIVVVNLIEEAVEGATP